MDPLEPSSVAVVGQADPPIAEPPTSGPAPGLAFGGPGERLVAYIVDSLLIAALAILVFLVGALLALVSTAVTELFWLVGVPLVSFGYFPWFWARGGQTPGLCLFGMRVVRDRDGGRVGPGAAILRLIGFWIDVLVFYLGFIWIFVDRRRRCWHDLIAGTVVVKPG